jgi:hypothetical protein
MGLGMRTTDCIEHRYWSFWRHVQLVRSQLELYPVFASSFLMLCYPVLAATPAVSVLAALAILAAAPTTTTAPAPYILRLLLYRRLLQLLLSLIGAAEATFSSLKPSPYCQCDGYCAVFRR